tara:strand:+ start:417 stop:830 length:414 start_codon:yes stop_codon:yes gene_type:complete
MTISSLVKHYINSVEVKLDEDFSVSDLGFGRLPHNLDEDFGGILQINEELFYKLSYCISSICKHYNIDLERNLNINWVSVPIKPTYAETGSLWTYANSGEELDEDEKLVTFGVRYSHEEAESPSGINIYYKVVGGLK